MPVDTPAQARQAMTVRNGFTWGALSGRGIYVLTPVISTGQLPTEYANRLRALQREREAAYLAGKGRDAIPDAPAYVVTSYGTPIAWVTVAGEVVIPPVTYNPTISRHQALARLALVVES
ncbi:hypothetical protein [Micromonospora sp. NPDC048839]|uniref:hypothetical protein n=1 Tax=Micromonospora sp. NPDC048839 TaxID=3155641 RepID=UPI0033E6C510